jgi:thiamine-phosphate pyrophosphorylase
LISRVKALAPIIQDKGAALLLDGHVDLVARGGADGAHLSGLAALEEALPTLKPDRIAGVSGLATRHDAMTAGELGADYVLFGEPDENGQRPSAAAIAERLQWWDEVFELPSVGFAGTLDEAGAFAAAGADFILAGDFVWSAPEGPAKALRAVSEAIGKAHAGISVNAEAPHGQEAGS